MATLSCPSPAKTEVEAGNTWTYRPRAIKKSDVARLIPTSANAKLAFRRIARRILGIMADSQPDFYLTPTHSTDTEGWKDYEIYPPFARGSQGTVAYATNRVTGAVCAVKKT